MKKDIDFLEVVDIGIAIVLESESEESRNWKAYLLNFKFETISNVLVSTKGYGLLNGAEVKTAIFRHSLGSLAPQSYTPIEIIDESLFVIHNEFWLSFYIGDRVFDKKITFLPDTISAVNVDLIPLIMLPGVIIR
jgi:hypothetical protein